MKRMMSFLIGAALGGLAGATLAILLAPYSGDDLRNQVQARVDRIRQEMENAANTRRAELEAQLQSLRSPAPPVE
jgi:gas vesicle protein